MSYKEIQTAADQMMIALQVVQVFYYSFSTILQNIQYSSLQANKKSIKIVNQSQAFLQEDFLKDRPYHPTLV